MSDQSGTKKIFQPVDGIYRPKSSDDLLSLPNDSYQAYETFQRVKEQNNFHELERPEEILERNLVDFAQFLSALGAHHASAIEQQLVTNTHLDPIIRAQLKKKLAELLADIIKNHRPPPTKTELETIKAKLHLLGQPASIDLDLP